MGLGGGDCGGCILIVLLLQLEVLAASRKVCVCSSCVEEKLQSAELFLVR